LIERPDIAEGEAVQGRLGALNLNQGIQLSRTDSQGIAGVIALGAVGAQKARAKVWRAPMPRGERLNPRVKLRELKVLRGQPERTTLEMLVESSLCSTRMSGCRDRAQDLLIGVAVHFLAGESSVGRAIMRPNDGVAAAQPVHASCWRCGIATDYSRSSKVKSLESFIWIDQVRHGRCR